MKTVLMPFAFMAVEFVAFLLATMNFRYCTKGHVRPTLITDVLIAANGFIVVKLVSDASSVWEMLGYTIGAGLGSWVGMILTKKLEE